MPKFTTEKFDELVEVLYELQSFFDRRGQFTNSKSFGEIIRLVQLNKLDMTKNSSVS